MDSFVCSQYREGAKAAAGRITKLVFTFSEVVDILLLPVSKIPGINRCKLFGATGEVATKTKFSEELCWLLACSWPVLPRPVHF